MCIICIKNKGVEMPDHETVKNMWTANSDGAGYMYANDKGEVVIKKGFMSLTSLESSLQVFTENHDTKNMAVVLHFRIGTAGGNIPANTHPFAISEKVPVLQKLRLKTDVGMVHNGIISITTSQPDISDTMEYIKDRLALRKLERSDFYKSEITRELMRREVKSKLAFLNGQGEVYLVGDFQTDEKTGLVYSNGTYKKTTYYLGNYSKWDYYDSMGKTKYKYLMIIDEQEGYLTGPTGIIIEPDNHFMDGQNNVYEYDFVSDSCTKTDLVAYTHSGTPMKYKYTKEGCDLYYIN